MINYTGPEESVECAFRVCANRLRKSPFDGDQFCSQAHRDGRATFQDLPPRGQAMLWLAGESEAYAQGSKYAESTDNREMIAQLVRTNDGDLWGFPFNYLKRAQLFGLDTPQGRQALGKAAATIIDYMTHVVEIHGPMPKPGVPSGEIEEWT